MIIGFPNNPRKNVASEVEWIGRSGFDYAELFLEEGKAAPERIDVDKVKKVLDKYGMTAPIGHTGWYLPIGSEMKTLRQMALAEAVRCFKILEQFNTKLVTIHSNWPDEPFSPELGISFQVETLKKLVKEAEKYNLSIMYEPERSPYDNIKNISTVLNSVHGLLLNLDIGHANLYGKRPHDLIKALHEKIVHVHLHDNNGDMDLHLPMGQGSIDWEKTISMLKKYYDGTITLEIFSEDKNQVLKSKERLRRLWNRL